MDKCERRRESKRVESSRVESIREESIPFDTNRIESKSIPPLVSPDGPIVGWPRRHGADRVEGFSCSPVVARS